ncbi:hypothetical protein LTR08_005613 [Meristemomyces frigidus]|nr:hypothetical protein LTR08_005613 [Meristemomyces frigidus]
MAKSLQQWLSPFLETELAAVIGWDKDVKSAPKIKQDPGSRFSDDGSNFRSAVGSPPLTTAGSKVQMLKVLAVSDPATVVLSDGAISIQAILSEEAIATLEEELEEKLSLDMEGDVLSLAAVTVVSTPYGPAEGHIRLIVDDWEYQYHLRKAVGDPKPIEQQQRIGRLLENIKAVRTQHYSTGDRDGQAPSAAQLDAPHTVLGASQVDRSGAQRVNALGSSRDGLQTQPAVGSSPSAQSQVRIATQLPPRKRIAKASLAKEGYELEGGVNLLGPSKPTMASAQQGASVTHRGPFNVSSDLLRLVGAIEKPRTTENKAPNILNEQSDPASQADNDLEIDVPVNHDRASLLSSPSSGDRNRYARRKIPSHQRRLLVKKFSVFPPPPGMQFPTPNVPVELLQTWNAEPVLIREVLPQQSASHLRGVAEAKGNSAAVASEVNESTDMPDSSSDEEIAEWSSSPSSPKRGMLPPDSTAGSGQGCLPLNADTTLSVMARFQLDLVLAKDLKGTEETWQFLGTARTVYHDTQTWYDLSMATRKQAPHAVVGRTVSLVAIVQRPILENDTRGTAERIGQNTVIQGTQFPSNGDEMELDVPRPLEDPAAAHRQRRTDHFKASQRRNWLEKRYISTHKARFTITNVHQVYLTAYPHDTVTFDEFKKAIEEFLAPQRQEWLQKYYAADYKAAPSISEVYETYVEDHAADPMELAEFEKAVLEIIGPQRRRDWLQENYVVGYDSLPYISNVHAAYIQAFPADRVALPAFKEAVEKVYPTLKGYPPRSLKLKRKVATTLVAAPSSVRRQPQLDGSSDADDDPRLGAARGEAPAAPAPARSAESVAGGAAADFCIYQDAETKAGPDDDVSGLERAPALRKRRTNGVTTTSSPLPGSEAQAAKLEVPPSRSIGDQQDVQPHRVVNSPRHAPHDPQTSEETPVPLPTAFQEFFSAWKQIAPGGAFAQAKTSTARSKPKNLDIGCGPSGLGTAIQLKRQNLTSSIEIIEKCGDVGGTWLVNTYPGCGCDVASHFYSYSFALNPNWSQKFSLRSEIQAYFRDVARQYDIEKHVRFHSSVQRARWVDEDQLWEVTIQDHQTSTTSIRRAKILVSAVGSLSVPKPCDIPGAKDFAGPLFHSALWDHDFEWQDKDVVVFGNGCSATQFVPIMAPTTKSLTQFARQAQFLAERPNPVYSETWKWLMRYVPLFMRVYRLKLYADMERDFAGFDIESGRAIREGLKAENERYVKRMAPERYWDALIPRHEIGCKRKVMDTDYLATLFRENVELVTDDRVEAITETGVRTRSGRQVRADAIVLATGFEVFRMLSPMEILGRGGVSLNEHWDAQHQGNAQAYLGTCVAGFPNFFTLMGPNTVTGHLSVIYTVECQINFTLRLVAPILHSLHSPAQRASDSIASVTVKPDAAARQISWMQDKLGKLVWSSGCTSWALDPRTGVNVAMYPEYQFLFWLRSVFIPGGDFEYVVGGGGGEGVKGSRTKRSLVVGGWKDVRQLGFTVVVGAAVALGIRRAGGVGEVRELVGRVFRGVVEESRGLLGGR